MRRVRRVVVLGSLAFVVGCTRPLPDADSPGALLYQARCGGSCHALYEPRALTAAMWEVQVQRMQETMRRSGASPLTGEEQRMMLSYLRAHATDAGGRP
jgi:hypothetical protein